jgi:hypothetical protein
MIRTTKAISGQGLEDIVLATVAGVTHARKAKAYALFLVQPTEL